MIAAATQIAGCATPPPASDPDAVAEFNQTNDPLEPMNRAIFDFNNGLDTVFLKPVAQGYRAVVPPFGRDRVSDFLANLNAPLIFANDLLQGNVSLAGKTLERFALNSSFGVFGIMDVATPLGVKPHQADFGQTLGVWGIGSGPYLVLPFFGPSGVRDGVGTGVELFADPMDIYLTNAHLRYLVWTRTGADAVSQREAYLDFLDDIKRTSLDFYATLRSLYRQRRDGMVESGIKGVEAVRSEGRPGVDTTQ
jgi:phospholipid-binding lipoprotein MlaA